MHLIMGEGLFVFFKNTAKKRAAGPQNRHDPADFRISVIANVSLPLKIKFLKRSIPYKKPGRGPGQGGFGNGGWNQGHSPEAVQRRYAQGPQAFLSP
jgi:hypothetical protein